MQHDEANTPQDHLPDLKTKIDLSGLSQVNEAGNAKRRVRRANLPSQADAKNVEDRSRKIKALLVGALCVGPVFSLILPALPGFSIQWLPVLFALHGPLIFIGPVILSVLSCVLFLCFARFMSSGVLAAFIGGMLAQVILSTKFSLQMLAVLGPHIAMTAIFQGIAAVLTFVIVTRMFKLRKRRGLA